MAIHGDNSNTGVLQCSTPITFPNQTIVSFFLEFYANVAPSITSPQFTAPVMVGTNTANFYRIGYWWDGPSSTRNAEFFYANAAGTQIEDQFTNYRAPGWNRAVFASDGTNIFLNFNGTERKHTDGITTQVTQINNSILNFNSNWGFSNLRGLPTSFEVNRVICWNVFLTAAERWSLMNGYDPRHVRYSKATLVFDYRLRNQNDLFDYSGNNLHLSKVNSIVVSNGTGIPVTGLREYPYRNPPVRRLSHIWVKPPTRVTISAASQVVSQSRLDTTGDQLISFKSRSQIAMQSNDGFSLSPVSGFATSKIQIGSSAVEQISVLAGAASSLSQVKSSAGDLPSIHASGRTSNVIHANDAAFSLSAIAGAARSQTLVQGPAKPFVPVILLTAASKTLLQSSAGDLASAAASGRSSSMLKHVDGMIYATLSAQSKIAAIPHGASLYATLSARSESIVSSTASRIANALASGLSKNQVQHRDGNIYGTFWAQSQAQIKHADGNIYGTLSAHSKTVAQSSAGDIAQIFASGTSETMVKHKDGTIYGTLWAQSSVMAKHQDGMIYGTLYAHSKVIAESTAGRVAVTTGAATSSTMVKHRDGTIYGTLYSQSQVQAKHVDGSIYATLWARSEALTQAQAGLALSPLLGAARSEIMVHSPNAPQSTLIARSVSSASQAIVRGGGAGGLFRAVQAARSESQIKHADGNIYGTFSSRSETMAKSLVGDVASITFSARSEMITQSQEVLHYSYIPLQSQSRVQAKSPALEIGNLFMRATSSIQAKSDETRAIQDHFFHEISTAIQVRGGAAALTGSGSFYALSAIMTHSRGALLPNIPTASGQPAIIIMS